MAAKVPIRAVFDGTTATGLAEFQSTEFIALAYGGLGASLSIGTAGQILKVNSGASALEFGSVATLTEIDSGSTVTLDATTDIVLDAGGGDVFFKDDGTTFGSATNTSGNLIIKSGTTTAATFSGANVTFAGTFTGGGLMTTGGNIVIPDAGNIGSASDTDAIAIASGGGVTLTQTLVGTAADFSGVVTATTFEPDGDTASGDNAAIGYTSTLGLILTGQGSTNDVTINNDADTAVIQIPTGGTAVTVAGALTAGGILKTDDATEATSTTDGSLQTDGGLSVVKDAVFGDDVKLLSDAAVISFGTNSEITATHVHNVGLTLTHTATGDNTPMILQLKSEEDAIVADEVISSLEFAAGDSDGTDGATVAAGIHAIAEGTFSASANATKLVFTAGVSETAASSATAKMTLSSAGLLTIADDLMIKDGGTIGVASTNDAITISSAGIVTFKDDILIKNGGTIGSAGDADSITIDSSGNVTASQNLTVTGNFTVNGTTTTVATTNMVVSDNLIELNNGAGSNANDSGIVIERGSTGDNAFIGWDESADKFIIGTTTSTAAATGNISITTGALVANIEGSGAGLTAGTTPLTTLDIDGGTDIGEAIVDADLFVIDNGAGGTNRKTTASRLKTYIGDSITFDHSG